MQDYYNMIPIYDIGGVIEGVEKLAKLAGRVKVQNYANMLSKAQSELSKLLSKLAKVEKGGPKLSEKEAKRLVTLAQDYRRNNIRYQTRRAKINEQLAAKRNPTPKATSAKPAQPAQTTNPVPGTTLSARWKQAKTWMNNHPKTTIGVPLLAFGTGPGRYVTGNALKATQSDPGTWFGDSPSQSGEATDFIMIDGAKIPIKKSAEGYFVPVTQDTNQTPTAGADDIDQILAGINSESSEAASQQDNTPVIDQQAINNLFDDDQW